MHLRLVVVVVDCQGFSSDKPLQDLTKEWDTRTWCDVYRLFMITYHSILYCGPEVQVCGM